MCIARVYSRADYGWDAPPICIETHIASGLPKFNLIGLPEATVRESKDRVRSALLNANFRFPAKRITVNLAPADLPKWGGRFDLPIALSLLAASKQINAEKLDQYEVAGELSLEGKLRATPHLLPFILATMQTHRHLIIPFDNKAELEMALMANNEKSSAQYKLAPHLLSVCEHFNGHATLQPHHISSTTPTTDLHKQTRPHADLPTVHCDPSIHRAITLAAAGCHNILLCGPPGNGKSTLARYLHTLLPPLTPQEALEVAMVKAFRDTRTTAWTTVRPFRAPHHTCSAAALIGGGTPPKPGEISLAQHGVLLLDELPEFSRHSLESLRQPLENGEVLVSRARHQCRFPANFQLVATMNPCPCGHAGETAPYHSTCQCTPQQIQRYRQKISGPLLDRIDIKIWVPAFPLQDILSAPHTPANNTTTQLEQTRTQVAYIRKTHRKKHDFQLNHVDSCARITLCEKTKTRFLKHIAQYPVSVRAYYRTLHLAKTIAHFDANADDTAPITYSHLMEALYYQNNPLMGEGRKGNKYHMSGPQVEPI